MGRRITECPCQVVAGDIMGPLPKATHGHEYILIFQDLFTRWIEVIPITRANGKSVIEGLNERVSLRFGVPVVFLSDNGTEFKNAPSETFLDERSVHYTFTPPYHLQAYLVERVNRTVMTMIMTYAEEKCRPWDEKLNELAFAYNTAEHSSTKKSPVLLNYGRQPDQSKTLRQEEDQLAEEQRQQKALGNWTSRMDKLRELHDLVASDAQAEQARQAKYYDAHRRHPEFCLSDLV